MRFRIEDAQARLRESVEIETHTPEGCEQYVQYVIDRVQRESIGEVRHVVYPPGTALAGEYSNIVIDIGSKGASERLLLQGHFDTVGPHADYFDDVGIANVRKPYELYVDPADPHLWYGLGAYDMKGGNEAALMAAKFAKLPPHRALRVLLVSREEMNSEGIHAAKVSGLLKDITCAVTTEIPVGGTLNDGPTLLHGRLGRTEFEVQVRGKSMHRGQGTKDEREHYAYSRLHRAMEAVWDIPIPEDPAFAKIRPGKAVVGNGVYRAMPGIMSVADMGFGRFDVYSLDPNLDPERVREAAREHIARVLGDTAFEIEVAPDRDSRLPPTPGCYLDPKGPFVELLHSLTAEAIKSRGYTGPITLGIGEATADEPLIGAPTVTIPPVGRHEHLATEVIDGRSITDIMVPAMVGIAEYQGDLRKVVGQTL